jgi:transcriptional regulator with XRE-family HTH domain
MLNVVYFVGAVRHPWLMTKKSISLPTAFEELPARRGLEIRQAREAAGLTQAELAAHAQTSQQTVDRIERGVTSHSRAYNRVREALGLRPLTGGSLERADWREKASYLELPEHLPVFGFTRMANLAEITAEPVRAVPRSYPLLDTKNGYGLLAFETDMRPAVNPGEIALFNPDLPPVPDQVVVVRREEAGRHLGMIRTLVDIVRSESWILRTWNSDEEITLKQADWPTAHVMVSKLSSYR